MEKSPELKKSGLDQTKHREKELARTAMSENIDTEKKASMRMVQGIK